jgi:hypothetical protein
MEAKSKHTAIRRRIQQIDCLYWKSCFEYILENLRTDLILDDNHYCFCQNCHEKRGDNINYYRGIPQKVYELPVGFAGFAVALNVQVDMDAKELFKSWHSSYHGTTATNFNSISDCGMKLYKPGEATNSGEVVKIRED